MDDLCEGLVESLHHALLSEHEPDQDGEPANVVDALFAIAHALEACAAAQARTADALLRLRPQL